MTMYIIIIMYIYHALINTDPERSDNTYLPKHNILYTCRAQSYQNNLHKVLYVKTNKKLQ